MQIKRWESETPDNYIPTEEESEIGKLLAEMGGNISAVSRTRNQSRRSLYRRIEASEYLQAVLDESRETILDEAEKQLHEAVCRGEGWAVCFTLKTIGKGRGFTERNTLDVNARQMTVADLVMQVAREEEEAKRLNGGFQY